ncbi:hypothetical protein [Peribacillus butanolivorans]|uniref:hypothetical protein n=1 Tax=Peribacillus butanolivorans TaxID=421767 RepID=UPI0035D96935
MYTFEKFSILAAVSLIALATYGLLGVNASNDYTVNSISTVSEKQSYEQDEDLRSYMHGINIGKEQMAITILIHTIIFHFYWR